jgi:hypothetical protein
MPHTAEFTRCCGTRTGSLRRAWLVRVTCAGREEMLGKLHLYALAQVQ